MLSIALVGSALFVVYGVVVRDATQVPMLCAGFAVLGIVFSALALGGAIATYRAASDGQGGRAFTLALLGGIGAIVAAGCFSTAVVLALVWRG
jgi:K+-transporting ATPase A subunit